MLGFIPWNSQPLDKWSEKYAPGKFIDLDGLTMHYVEKGAGDPVILIHGFFFDHNMWNRCIDMLAERYKVYAIDLWGFGFSSREPLDYGYPLYARQLRQFMDTLGIEKASLAGQSMGAGTIVKFTVANRSRVDKVILVNAAGMPNPLPLLARLSNLPGLGEFLFALPGNFMRRFTLKNNFLYREDLLTVEVFDQLTRFHKIKRTSEIMLQITRKQFFDTLIDEIKEFAEMDVPTLIVWGKEEKSIPLPVAERLASILSNAQFEVLNQAGHCSHMDQPDRFNALALEHLASG